MSSPSEPESLEKIILGKLGRGKTITVRDILPIDPSVSEEELVEEVERLEKNGAITLSGPKFASFPKYLFSFEWSYIFWAFLPLEALDFLSVYLLPATEATTLFRAALNLSILLLVPGFYVSIIIFPRSIGVIERAVLSVALSIGLNYVMGVFLSFTVFGIQTNSILLGQLFLVAVCATAAAKRTFDFLNTGRALNGTNTKNT